MKEVGEFWTEHNSVFFSKSFKNMNMTQDTRLQNLFMQAYM